METSEVREVQSAGDADPVQIAFAIDDGYVRQTITALHSICLHTLAPVEVHVIFTDLASESQYILRNAAGQRGARLHFHRVREEWLGNFPDSPHYSKATFLRLRLPELLFAHPKCIYLDPDILVRHDIEELWNVQLQGKAVAGIKDIELATEHGKRIGLPAGHTYFNAGVLVLDLAALRRADFEKAAIQFAQSEPHRVLIVDQDILNILLAHNVAYLSLKWNYCPLWTDHGESGSFKWRNIQTYYDEAERLAADRDPALVHFANIHKPWHISVESIEHPFQEEYRRCDEQANPDGFPRLRTSKPALSCVLPVCDADNSALKTITSLLSQAADDIEIVAFSLVQGGRVTALLETAARWHQSFKLVPVGDASPAEGLRAALRSVSAGKMIFIPPGTFVDGDFLSRVTKQLSQAKVGPAGRIPTPVWTKESWWRIVIESEAARRATEHVCHSVGGNLAFYCTILQVWLDDPGKLEPVAPQARAWDARQTPRLLSEDVLEFRGFTRYTIRHGERAKPASGTRSLFNCFRYLDPREKWKFLLGLAKSELPVRTTSCS